MLEGNQKIFSIKEATTLKQSINNHIIKLIRQKVVPLNRSKYQHLQKVNLAYRNHSSEPSQNIKKETFIFKDLDESSKEKAYSARHQLRNNVDSIMNNQLKKLKFLKINSQIVNSNRTLGECWEKLRKSIVSIEDKRPQKKDPVVNLQKKRISVLNHTSRKKRQNLLELAIRAEQYLKSKKKELKERYCQQQQYTQHKKKHKESDIQLLINKFIHPKPQKTDSMNNELLQKQLLKQIRQNMIPTTNEHIQRIKRQTNHKRIVMLK